MQKSDVYVVLTNNTINIVTTDPNVADAAKAKTPGSIVKRFPLTAKFQNGNGIVGEALDGDFEMGDEEGADNTIGQDDVEFVDGPAPEDDGEFDDQAMDDEGVDENADVICMDTELAVRIFEYIAQNQIEGEELQAIADKMADLGNDSDDVLTVEHFDEITGGEDTNDQEFGDDEFADDAGTTNDNAGYSDDETSDALEIGEGAYDGDQMDPRDDQLIQQYQSGEISREEFLELLQNGTDQEYDMVASDIDPYGNTVTDEFGEYDREDEEFEECMDYRLGEDSVGEGIGDTIKRGVKSVKRAAQGWGDGVTPKGIKQRASEYSDDEVTGLAKSYDELRKTRATLPTSTDVPKHSPAGLQKRILDREMKKRGLGEDTAPGQQQADPTIDAQYMNGYNTGKRGGQAAPQNINTPAGAAYNSGFSDAKAGKPPVAPSKRQNESASTAIKRGAKAVGNYLMQPDPAIRKQKAAMQTIDDYEAKADAIKRLKSSKPVKEGVETFATFLKKIEEKNPVAPTVAALFKSKKKADIEKPSNVEDKHFEIVQDSKTTAVKITNDSTTGVQKSSNTY